jgi:hypothetical protein
MPASRTTPRFGPALGASLGFVLVAGGFSAGLALHLHHADPAATLEPAAVEAPAEPAMKLYMPFGEELILPSGAEGTVVADLTLSIEGPVTELMEIKTAADARMPDLRARVVEAAQQVAETLPPDAAGGDGLRRALPEALRSVMNTEMGTEALPEPVREVLFTRFMEQ